MPVRTLLRWSIALCILGTSFIQARVQAQPQIELLSSWGGPVLDFQRVGNIGYAAVGQKLVILDLSNEANIHELSSVMMTGKVESVAVRGNHAYVGGYFDRGRLVAVNISNPSSPVVVWREYVADNFTPVYQSVQHLCFYNNLLLAHNRDNGNDPVAYDITNPAQPVALLNDDNIYYVPFFDTATGVGYPPRDFQIVGDLAYVAPDRASTTIAIFNMQPNPMRPTFVGRLTNTDTSRGRRIAVEGNKAVVQVSRVIGAGNFVRFVDVSNPASPVLANANNDFASARDVAVQGNLAFVADWAGGINSNPSASPWARLKGLAIFDMTNLASPVLLGTYNTAHSSIREVQVIGNRAYAMCDGQGLVVLDISNPANPTRIGNYYSPGQLRKITKVGNLLYAADQWNGFTILDVSNPSVTPTVLGVYRAPGGITSQHHRQVVVRDNLAYLAAGNGGIQIVDVSSPNAPSLVFHYPTNYLATGRVDSVELDGNVLHTGQQEFEPIPCGVPPTPGFFNYDISNPRVISRLIGGNYESYGCGMSILGTLASRGGVTFSGLQGGTIATIVLNNSSGPGPVNMNIQSWGGDDMEVQGNYLYIANNNDASASVSIIDIADPFQPNRVGTWSPWSPNARVITRSIGVSGNIAFVGSESAIDVLDVSNPASPAGITRSIAGGAADIFAEGNLCYSTYFGFASPNPAGPLLIQRLVACGSSDFDGDGDYATDADIEAFFACLAGNCCATCYPGGADFNADGDYATDADIESFFRVLAGGPC